MFSIRPFNPPTDYPGIAAVWNTAWPEIPRSVRQWRQADALRPPALSFERLVVDMADEIVGFGELMQNVEPETPHDYWAALEILPAYQRMNICTALYSRLLGALQRLNAQRVLTSVRVDQSARVQFLQERGFRQMPATSLKIPVALAASKLPAADPEPQWIQFGKQLNPVFPSTEFVKDTLTSF